MRLQCAEVVFSITNSLRATQPDQLSGARRALASLVQAKIEAGDTIGLPAGRRLPALDTLERAAAEQCLIEADAATLPPAYSLLLWPGADPRVPGIPTDPAPIEWTALPGAIDAWGPFTTSRADGTLPAGSTVWLYRKAVAGALMLRTRLTGDVAPAAAVVTPAGPAPASPEPARPRWRGIWFVIAALVVFLVGAGSLVTAGQMVRAAAGDFQDRAKTLLDSGAACAPPQDFTKVPPGWITSFDGKAGDCLALWRSSYAAMLPAVPAASDTLVDSVVARGRSLLLQLSIGPSGARLWLPAALVLISFGLLFLAAGQAVLGMPLGGLIDERNRFSLTRTQLVSWSLLLVAGITALGLFNVGFGGSDWGLLTRAAALEADLLPDSARSSVLENLVEHIRMFPQMNMTLWTLLGFSVGTTVLSSLITGGNRAKVVAEPEAPHGGDRATDTRVPTAITVRSSSDEASLADVVLGETIAKTGIVDVSRVQHVAITALLVTAYAALLVSLMSRVDGYIATWALANTRSFFVAMPGLDSTFIALLTITHAGLLASKISDRVMG